MSEAPMDYTSDDGRLKAFATLDKILMEAMARGEMSVKVELSVWHWLNILDEVKDRQPRNYSALLRDDLVARMNAAIDRVHEEANYIAAFSPGLVADRFDPNRKQHGRQMASPELQAQLRKGHPT